MPTPLDNYPAVRTAIYNLYWTAGILIGCISAWYLTTAGHVPTWLLGVTNVYAYVGIPIGYVAATNVQKPGDQQ